MGTQKIHEHIERSKFLNIFLTVLPFSFFYLINLNPFVTNYYSNLKYAILILVLTMIFTFLKMYKFDWYFTWLGLSIFFSAFYLLIFFDLARNNFNNHIHDILYTISGIKNYHCNFSSCLDNSLPIIVSIIIAIIVGLITIVLLGLIKLLKVRTSKIYLFGFSFLFSYWILINFIYTGSYWFGYQWSILVSAIKLYSVLLIGISIIFLILFFIFKKKGCGGRLFFLFFLTIFFVLNIPIIKLMQTNLVYLYSQSYPSEIVSHNVHNLLYLFKTYLDIFWSRAVFFFNLFLLLIIIPAISRKIFPIKDIKKSFDIRNVIIKFRKKLNVIFSMRFLKSITVIISILCIFIMIFLSSFKVKKIDLLLFQAVEEGDKQSTVNYIDQGANINIQDYTGRSLLHESVVREFEDITLLLLKHGIKVNARDMYGDTPFQYIFNRYSSGNDLGISFKLADMLIEYKADINLPDYRGFTSLHKIVEEIDENDIEKMKFLLKYKPDIELKTSRNHLGEVPNMTALDIAILHENHEFIKIIKKYKGNTDEKVFPLVRERKFQTAKELIMDKNLDVDDRDLDGSAMIHWVVYYGDEDFLLFLLKRGADIDMQLIKKIETESLRFREGSTPLYMAVKLGNINLVKLLLQKGADADLGFYYDRGSYGVEPKKMNENFLLETAQRKEFKEIELIIYKKLKKVFRKN